jgi:hypothetical protein
VFKSIIYNLIAVIVVSAGALFLNITVLLFIPFCPESEIGHVASDVYCRSFVWAAAATGLVHICVIILIFLFARWKRFNHLATNLLCGPPVLLLVYGLYSYTFEALDRIAPESGDKVEYTNLYEIHLAYIIIAITLIAVFVAGNILLKKKAGKQSVVKQ